MDEKTREALEESIKHWEANVAADTPNEASVNGEDCALCVAFPKCKGCPIAERTGETDCEGTPYYSARHAFREWLFHDQEFEWLGMKMIQSSNIDTKDARALWREAAQTELDFLISLRPD